MKFMGGFFLSSSRVVILQGHVLFICFRGRRLPEGFVDPSYVEDALLLWDSEARRDGRRCTLRVSGRTFRLTFADEQVASRWVEMLRKASGSHSFQEKAMSQIVSLLQLAREAIMDQAEGGHSYASPGLSSPPEATAPWVYTARKRPEVPKVPVSFVNWPNDRAPRSAESADLQAEPVAVPPSEPVAAPQLRPRSAPRLRSGVYSAGKLAVLTAPRSSQARTQRQLALQKLYNQANQLASERIPGLETPR
ncbi:unnamed protein product [Durusdinium trenchii]|uniref:PH domain-containing protein n=1 Tax=Durusdinium trenchii TaxID=1381693 RepID=A0ABP0PPG8_9DINO